MVSPVLYAEIDQYSNLKYKEYNETKFQHHALLIFKQFATYRPIVAGRATPITSYTIDWVMLIFEVMAVPVSILNVSAITKLAIELVLG
jgi:hypothetical protein